MVMTAGYSGQNLHFLRAKQLPITQIFLLRSSQPGPRSPPSALTTHPDGAWSSSGTEGGMHSSQLGISGGAHLPCLWEMISLLGWRQNSQFWAQWLAFRAVEFAALLSGVSRHQKRLDFYRLNSPIVLSKCLLQHFSSEGEREDRSAWSIRKFKP